jgi:putative acetyltransferase
MRDGVTIRDARADDLPGCARIINDFIDATDWLPRTLPRDEIAALFGPDLLDRRRILVAEADEGLVGYLSMGDDGFMPALYLAPAARGRGIGARLLDRAKTLRPEGIELTVFEPNTDAQRFYAREGFRAVPGGRVTSTEEGVPTLRLRWEATA